MARRLVQLVGLENEIEVRLGSLLAQMNESRAWSRLGFASLGDYGEERLGLARRTVENRAGLSRSLAARPILRQAYEAGRIGLEATLLVQRALHSGRVDPETERRWTRHACKITVKRLRDELAMLRRREAGLDVGLGAGEATLHRPPTDAAWHASLFRVPGSTRERLARLGALALDARSNVRLHIEVPEDVGERFLACLESAAGLLVRRVESPPAEMQAPASLQAARTFSRRGEPLRGWAPLVAVLEHFVEVWDRAEMVPRHAWMASFRRDGYRCMAPGCTARSDLHGHHIWHRAHRGPNDSWNVIPLCWLHHRRGVHGDWARVSGRAPLDLVWRLGTEELASWYRNERRLDRARA